MKRQAVHPAIRARLGFPDDMLDDEVWNQWVARSTKVCKPCWELKYCPYGPFVDQSPLLPPTRKDAIAANERFKAILKTRIIGERRPIDDETRASYEKWIRKLEDDPLIFADFFANEIRVNQIVQQCVDDGIEDPIGHLLKEPKPPIERFRTAFPIEEDDEFWDRLESDFTPEVQAAIQNRIEAMKESLLTGVVDETRPLDDVRRKHLEAKVNGFNENDYPEAIPEAILQTSCNVFGHICPVVFVAETVTETSDEPHFSYL